MDNEFVRISVFRDDYWKLNNRFGDRTTRPAKGILVNKALNYIDELVKDSDRLQATIQVLQRDIDDMNTAIKENVK